MFLAGLLSIPEELVEAARVDGASAWQIFWRIKLPLLLPVIGIVSILTFVGNFNAFDIVYAMAGARGDPKYAADLMGTFFYRTAIAGEHPVARPNMGIGAAVATIRLLDPAGRRVGVAVTPRAAVSTNYSLCDAQRSSNLAVYVILRRVGSRRALPALHDDRQLGQAPDAKSFAIPFCRPGH